MTIAVVTKLSVMNAGQAGKFVMDCSDSRHVGFVAGERFVVTRTDPGDRSSGSTHVCTADGQEGKFIWDMGDDPRVEHSGTGRVETNVIFDGEATAEPVATTVHVVVMPPYRSATDAVDSPGSLLGVFTTRELADAAVEADRRKPSSSSGLGPKAQVHEVTVDQASKIRFKFRS